MNWYGMKKSNDAARKITAVLILAVFVWAAVSLCYFSHIHIDQQGRIILHSHPYDKHAGPSEADTGHSHTQQEFIFLALLYHGLSLVTAVFVLFTIILTTLERVRYSAETPAPASILSGTISHRGPPLLTFSF